MKLEPITHEDALELYLDHKRNEAESQVAVAPLATPVLRRLVPTGESRQLERLERPRSPSVSDLAPQRRQSRIDERKSQMDSLGVSMRFCETIDAVPKFTATKVVSSSISSGEESRNELLDADVVDRILDYLATYHYASEPHVCLHLIWLFLLWRGSVRALDVGDYDASEQAGQTEAEQPHGVAQ